MVNDNQSSGQGSSSTTGQGKQQTSDMSQGAASTQQGSGSSGAQQGSYAGSQGSGQGYGSSQAHRRQGEGQRGQSWQPSGSALQTRGGGSVSPFGAYGAGPFSMMRRISDEMDRLFESFGLGRGLLPSEYGLGGSSLWGSEGINALWSPHVEVSERDGKIVVAADLPGVKKGDVSVEINPDSVVIQGQRQQESTRNERGYYHSERTYGSFHRVIPLPEGADFENAAATFRDGVLQIEIPAPKQQSRGRTLEIKGG